MDQIIWVALIILVGATSLLDGSPTTPAHRYTTNDGIRDNSTPYGKPDVFVSADTTYMHIEELTLRNNQLFTTFPLFGKQYSVAFEVKPTEFLSCWATVIHLSQGGNEEHYGDRTPGIWFRPGVPGLSIWSAVNGNYDYVVYPSERFTKGEWIALKIVQFKSADVYRYQIFVNHKMIHDMVNNQPADFKHVNVYGGDPYYNTQPGSIRNLFINNKGFVNLAVNKTATASSQYKWFGAKLAVDGITTTNFYNNSCMHTGFDKAPWLRIDLFEKRHVSFIYEVLVYNRKDCCSRRANNMIVEISNDADGKNATICGNRVDMDTEVARFVCSHPQVGRFVHIRIPGPQYLHLCEVKVMGERITNLPLINGRIESSTIDSNYPQQSMIDGNLNTRFETIGNHDPKPWVRLTLHTEASIFQILVYRGQGRVSRYAANALLTIGNDIKMQSYGTLNEGEEILSGGYYVYQIDCRGAQGYYVKLQKRDDNYLSIAEIEVYGVYSIM